MLNGPRPYHEGDWNGVGDTALLALGFFGSNYFLSVTSYARRIGGPGARYLEYWINDKEWDGYFPNYVLPLTNYHWVRL